MWNVKTKLFAIGAIAAFGVVGTLMYPPLANGEGAADGPTVTINHTQFPLPVKIASAPRFQGAISVKDVDPSLAQTPPDFPMWCTGTEGMASSSGKNLIIDFTPSSKRAPDGLDPGQCSWLDRSLNSDEPTRIVSEQFSVSTAKQVAGEINQGADWTFWVFNAGRSFKGTASSRGHQRRKPSSF